MNPFDQNWNDPVTGTCNTCTCAAPAAYADITVVLDRSSSMNSMKGAVIEGLNTQIKKMRI